MPPVTANTVNQSMVVPFANNSLLPSGYDPLPPVARAGFSSIVRGNGKSARS
jgi:hypothetical protein